MSDYSLEEHDPFASPTAAIAGLQPAEKRLLPYCMVMFVVSLVLGVIRIPLAFLSIIGWATLAADGFPDGNAPAVSVEVISGIGMAVFGVAGNIALLCRKTWGFTLAYGLVVSVLLSYIAMFLSIAPLADAHDDLALYIGGAVVVAARVVVLMAYLLALWKFSEWTRSEMSFWDRIWDE